MVLLSESSDTNLSGDIRMATVFSGCQIDF